MSGPEIPPPVLEPGPRTAQQRTTTALVVFATALGLVAIVGTAAMLIYLIASGQI